MIILRFLSTGDKNALTEKNTYLVLSTSIDIHGQKRVWAAKIIHNLFSSSLKQTVCRQISWLLSKHLPTRQPRLSLWTETWWHKVSWTDWHRIWVCLKKIFHLFFEVFLTGCSCVWGSPYEAFFFISALRSAFVKIESRLPVSLKDESLHDMTFDTLCVCWSSNKSRLLICKEKSPLADAT